MQIFLIDDSYILFAICWPGQGNEKGVPTTVEVAIDRGVQVFTFKQLYAATSGFSKDSVIGHGGFGSVHKGILPDGRKIAVKLMDHSRKRGEEEFKVEVRTLNFLVICHNRCSWKMYI